MATAVCGNFFIGAGLTRGGIAAAFTNASLEVHIVVANPNVLRRR